jgi:hypothetical protein
MSFDLNGDQNKNISDNAFNQLKDTAKDKNWKVNICTVKQNKKPEMNGNTWFLVGVGSVSAIYLLYKYLTKPSKNNNSDEPEQISDASSINGPKMIENELILDKTDYTIEDDNS